MGLWLDVSWWKGWLACFVPFNDVVFGGDGLREVRAGGVWALMGVYFIAKLDNENMLLSVVIQSLLGLIC